MGWYFSSVAPENSIQLPADGWICMFSFLNDVANGSHLCFSEGAVGCAGASCYLGFSQPNKMAGSFLASKEKYKQNSVYGIEFYKQIEADKPRDKYLVFANIEHIENGVCIEVVNYWISPLVLSGLVTLSNFDSSKNDNVAIPFSSGCQGMWTIPYKERDKQHPKATVGALDPSMRKYIPSDTLLFSVPANRFFNLAITVRKSFARETNWLELIHTNLVE